MFKALVLLSICLLTACSTTQTTSGKEYLARHTESVANNTFDSKSFQDALRQAVSVEPTLRFPARIGIAKVTNGKLTNLSGDDVQIWDKLRQNLGPKLGELVPVNPLVAQTVSSTVAADNANELNKIRLGAARQHLDAVIIYETYSKADTRGNLISFIADVSLIGAFIVPANQVKAEGFASATLIDVMQAYPYGSVDTIVEKGDMLSTTIHNDDNKLALSDTVQRRATEKLVTEVEDMLQKLMATLSAKK